MNLSLSTNVLRKTIKIHMFNIYYITYGAIKSWHSKFKIISCSVDFDLCTSVSNWITLSMKGKRGSAEGSLERSGGRGQLMGLLMSPLL